MLLMLSLILLCLGFIIGNNLGIAQGRLEKTPLPQTIKVEIIKSEDSNEIPFIDAEVIDAEYVEVEPLRSHEDRFNKLVKKRALAAYKREGSQCSTSNSRRLHFYA